jgi:hypothetical protein
MSKNKTQRKSLAERVYPKCIYCQMELTKRKSSGEHVVNRSILPKYNNKITLKNKVCRECNESFTEIDKAFVKNTIIGFNKTVMDIVNDEERWDKTQEPFVAKNLSVTIRGDKEVFTLETNEKQEKNLLRGIAKIALNALIYDVKGKKSESITDKQGNCHYACVRNDEIFNGDEEVLSDIKKFIKEGGKFPIHIVRERISLQIYDKNMDIQGKKIPMKNITNPTHIIVIHKIQSHYYAIIGLFIGIDENAPLYFVPLIGDKNEIDPYCINPEEVRMYNFRYLVKKQPEQESIRPYIIDMAEGNSAYLITPVNNPKWIHDINMSKNNQ